MWHFVVFWGMSVFVRGGWGQCQSGYSEVFAEAGSQAVLPCVCRPTSVSAAVVQWSKDSKGMVWRKSRSGLEYRASGTKHVQLPQTMVGVGDYSMYINKVSIEDGGMYTCMVLDGEKHLSNKVFLRIMTVAISPTSLVESLKMKIICSVQPWPAGATVSWNFNKNTIDPKSFALRTTQKGVLEGTASANMVGNWSCVIGSHSGKQGKASTALTMRGIVNPSSHSATMYAEVGSDVTLPCVFSNGLTPLQTVWERLDSPGSVLPLSPSFNQSSLPPWDVSASMWEVRQEDGGRYRCSAVVEGCRLAREIQLVTAHVLISKPSTQKASVTLTCHLSNTSGVIDYDWVQVNPNSTQSVSSIRKGRDLRINMVADSNADQWVCRFHGEQGVLGNVTYHLPLMSGLIGETPPDGSSKAVVVVGLGFLLLVLLLVLVQMYRNQRRRKMIMQYPALETIVHSTANEREDRERNRVKADQVSK